MCDPIYCSVVYISSFLPTISLEMVVFCYYVNKFSSLQILRNNMNKFSCLRLRSIRYAEIIWTSFPVYGDAVPGIRSFPWSGQLLGPLGPELNQRPYWGTLTRFFFSWLSQLQHEKVTIKIKATYSTWINHYHEKLRNKVFLSYEKSFQILLSCAIHELHVFSSFNTPILS